MNDATPQRLDHYLPEYDFSEKHWILIRSSPEKVFEALHRFDIRASRITCFLLSLRSVFEPIPEKQDDRKMAFIDRLTGAEGFMTVLEEVDDREIVIGSVGKFWQIRPAVFRPRNAEEFIDFDDPDYVKCSWNLHIEKSDADTVTLSTESRILCLGNRSKRRFRPYWVLIRLFSGFTRHEMLRIIKNITEDCKKEDDG